MCKDKAHEDADDKCNENIPKNLPPPNPYPAPKSPITPCLIPGFGPIMGPVAEFGFGTGCYVFGDDMQSWGHIYWGWFFHYLTLVFGSLLVSNLFFTRWPNRKWVLTILGAWCICLASFYIKSSWPSLPPPAFSARFTWMQHYASVQQRNWYVVGDQSLGSGQRTRIAGSWLLEFTNLKGHPMTIDNWSIEEKLTNATWKTLEIFLDPFLNRTKPFDDPRIHGRVFFASEITHAIELKYQTFESQIPGASIQPYVPIRGWIHFKEWPTGGELRLSIADVTGQIYREPIFCGTASAGGFPAQSILFESTTNHEDISRLDEIR
jgi:hypothetical protein